MKTTLFSRWLPAIAKDTGRTTVAVVLLGLVIGAPAAVDAAQDPARPRTGSVVTAPADEAERAAEEPASRATADRDGTAAERDAAEETGTAEEPSMATLIPHGTQGPQQVVDWNDTQVANAGAIVDTTKKLGLDERAAVVAVATAMQESTLNNFGHLGARNDHDSQGLFQQRPSSGWGSPEQITNPEYATTAFLRALERVNGWREMPLTSAAQTVQVSAYPYHYAKWEQSAAHLVQELWTR